MNPQLRVMIPMFVLIAGGDFLYVVLGLPHPLLFAFCLAWWTMAGTSRVFRGRFAASSMGQAIRGVVMVVAWPLVPRRE